MRNTRAQVRLNALKLFDLFAMIGCFLLASTIVAEQVPKLSFSDLLAMQVRVSNFLLLGLFAMAWHSILAASGLYDITRVSSLGRDALDVLRVTSLGVGLLFAFSVTGRIEMANESFLIVFWSFVSSSMVFGRWFLRFALRRVRAQAKRLCEVVLIGLNDRALELARKIDAKPELGYRISGFFDASTGGVGRIEEAGYHWLGTLEGLRVFLWQHAVDEVIVCLPIKSFYTEIAHIVAACEQQGIIVRLRPDLFDLVIGRARVDDLDGLPIMTVTTGVLDNEAAAFKRLLDIIGSGVLLALLSPVLLVTTLLVKATSPGPAFFIQNRLGCHKRIFRMYKFRTMVQEAERMQQELECLNEADGPAFKIRDDPRITPIGQFLRKTSIDELPQLFNVLKGDMSLVGPRPMAVRDYNNFSEDWHRRRFSVKPGITCLWQVSGRSNLAFHQWMKLDMFYIDHWSLWLDMKILLKTIPAVLLRRGAR
jgi:exopolysaccharide biosynthesis polyprenyl glycosylphosphotransferase